MVTTALSSSSVAVGGAGAHDTATLSGLTGSTFTGDTVTYTVYPSQSSCTSGSGGTSEGSVTVSGNGPAAPSNTFAPTSTGTYYWQATFNGADKTNAAASSDCSSEPLTADGVTTSLSSSSATVGGAGVHDTATLSGLTGSTFTGDTVTYTVYPSQSSCTSGSGGTSEGSVTVSGNGPPAPSNTFAPTSTGTYYWQATFNGADKTNAAASSDCSSEALTAAAPTVPTVTTALSSSSVAVGGAGIQDTATLSGLTGSTFTGDTVTYTVYPSQSSCTSGSGGTSEGSVTVSGNGPAAPSNTFAPTSTGTYYWQATFNGADKTNAAASSDCSSEALTVYQTAPVPQRGKGGSSPAAGSASGEAVTTTPCGSASGFGRRGSMTKARATVAGRASTKTTAAAPAAEQAHTASRGVVDTKRLELESLRRAPTWPVPAGGATRSPASGDARLLRRRESAR